MLKSVLMALLTVVAAASVFAAPTPVSSTDPSATSSDPYLEETVEGLMAEACDSAAKCTGKRCC
jgi:hypothetical protein